MVGLAGLRGKCRVGELVEIGSLGSSGRTEATLVSLF